MADIKINDLTAYTNPVSTDVLPIVDIGNDLTKKVTIADLLENAGTGSAAAPSFSFDADPDTGMYRSGTNALAFTTAGNGRLFIDSSGNVGIGGAVPASPNITLNADGSAEFAGSVKAVSFQGMRANENDVVFLTTDEAGTTASRGILIDRNGRIRLGGSLANTASATGNITLNADGSASFTGSIITDSFIRAGDNPANGGDVGSSIGNNGAIASCVSTGTQAAYRIYTNGDSTETASILGNGSASFASGDVNIDSSGNVGIGTTSPGRVLEIKNAAPIIRLTDTDNNYSEISANTSILSLRADESNGAADTRIDFKVDGTEHARIDSSGKLLVGASSAPFNNAGAKFQVVSSGTTSLVLARNDGSVGANQDVGSIRFYSNDGGSYQECARIAAEAESDYANNDKPTFLSFSTTADGASSPTEYMRINSSGNMLIGTTAATGFAQADDFTVSRAGDAGITIRSGTASSGTLAFSDGTGGGASEYRGLIQYSHLNNYLAFSTNSTERMIIDSSGRMLVGVSASIPVASAVFQGNSSGSTSYGALKLARGTATPASDDALGSIMFSDSGHDPAATIIVRRDAGTWTSGSSQPTNLAFNTTENGSASTTERMRIDSSGKIRAVGTSSTARIVPNVDNVGYLGESGNRWQAVYAVNGTIQTSDSRQKTEITGSSLGYEFIKSLRPVSYKWIDGGNNVSYNEEGELVYTEVPGKRNHYGFIAQEVKEALGSTDFGGWVVEDVNDAESVQSLRYSEFIAPLTKALQEAIAKIETLEQRLTDAGL